MSFVRIARPEGVTLVGGGPLSSRNLQLAQALAPHLVAVDGGADHLLQRNLMPEAVIGDLDSLSAAAKAAIPAAQQFGFLEQDSTDFDKALRSVQAPMILGVGFMGGRLDHQLAVLNTLVRHSAQHPHGPACILLGAKEIAFAAPPRPITLMLRPKDVVSLFPLAAVQGRSRGLQWPIEGLFFAPDGFIGTSNAAIGGAAELAFERPGMIVILPKARLKNVIAALRG